MTQKVSILVPVYGAEEHIAQCAESLFSQSYKDIEYVFVDDCTPDGSIDVLRQVLANHPERKDEVKIIRNTVNLGSSATRDVAFKASTGDWIMFVDSDDTVPLNAVASLCDVMGRGDVDLAEGAYTTFGKENATIEPYICRSTDEYVKRTLCRYRVSHALWGKMYRRGLFTDSGVAFISGLGDMEDYCLMARLAFYVKRREATSDVVYNYRLEGTSFFNKESLDKRLVSQVMSHKEVLDFYKLKDKDGNFSFALQLGVMGLMRSLCEHNASVSLMRNRCGYEPTGVFVLLSWLYSMRLTQGVATFISKLLRNLYFKIK